MKIQYRFTTEVVEIDVAEDWGNRILEFNRADYNSERKDHRADHKYCPGTPITISHRAYTISSLKIYQLLFN